MSNGRLSVLWLTPFLPYPPNHGGAVRIYNLLKRLGAEASVDLMALVDDEPNLESVAILRDFCRSVRTFKRNSSLNLFPPRLAPPAVYLDDVPAMRRAVRISQANDPADVLQMEYPSLSSYLTYRSRSVTLLTEHDVTFLSLYRRSRWEHSYPTKFRRALAAAVFLYYELRHLPRYHSVITMSEHDRRLLLRWLPGLKTEVIPNGVDTSAFSPTNRVSSPDRQFLLYVGNFAHPPNVDAALFFLQDIWPELARRYPRLHFVIAGKPSASISRIQAERVLVTGWVPDLRPYYAEAAALVVPVRYGSGTRLKVLEAFAAGVPVVSTALGVEGIEAQHGRHLLLADKPSALVEQIGRLLSDLSLGLALADNARELATTRYDWKRLSERQLELYERVLKDAKNICG